MRKSTDRILTTHVGSLPAPPDLWSLKGVDQPGLSKAVREVVQFQRDCGVDIVNEGEITKGGNWVAFINERLTGFEPGTPGASAELLMKSEDWLQFGEFYKAALEGGTLFEQTRAAPRVMEQRLDWSCTGPVKGSMPTSAIAPCASKRSITHSRGFRRNRSAITFAGVAGTVHTPTTSPWPVSSIRCCR